MNEEIKVGDSVELKSGIPRMTVTSIRSDVTSVMWIDFDENIKELQAPNECFRKLES